MSCKICGRGACASYFHSSEERELYSRAEVISGDVGAVVALLTEIDGLKSEIEEKNKILESLENHE